MNSFTVPNRLAVSLFLTLVHCWALSALLQGQTPNSNPDEDTYTELDQWLIRLLAEPYGDSAYLKYLFADAELSSSQFAAFSKIINDCRLELSRRSKEISSLRDDLKAAENKAERELLQKKVASIEESLDQVYKNYSRQIKGCLLDHQLTNLVTKLKIRAFLKASGRKALEFPLFSKVEMTASEKRILEKVVEKELDNFASKELELRDEAWHLILSEAPAATKEKLKAIIGKDRKYD